MEIRLSVHVANVRINNTTHSLLFGCTTEPNGPGSGMATHYGGSRSVNEHAIALANELKLPDYQIDWEVFLRIHAKNGDYTSSRAKRIAERVYELAHEQRELQDSGEEQDVDMNSTFIKVARENSSKGRMIGLGNRSSLQTELEIERDERARIMEQVQAEREERLQLEQRLQMQAAEQERQKEESARIKEQLNILMQQFMRSGPPPS